MIDDYVMLLNYATSSICISLKQGETILIDNLSIYLFNRNNLLKIVFSHSWGNKDRYKLFTGNHWSEMLIVSQRMSCADYIVSRDLAVKTRPVQETPKGQTFWNGTVARSVAYAVSDANADTLCASRREEEVGESTFGSFIYNKL